MSAATATRTRRTTAATTSAPVEETVTETATAEEAPKPRRGRPRKTSAPDVKPMFSDNPEEATDPEGVAEAEIEEAALAEETTERPDKERRMQIRSEFVPGKTALATLTPDALEELAFVSTYESKDEQSSSPRQHGYQREPISARYPGIGRYYAQEDNDKYSHEHLIPAIIASVRVYSEKEKARFNFLFDRGEIGKIHQEFGKSVFSIVDGQHRKGGLYWAWNRYEAFNPDVPVMLYYGLRYSDEAKLFDDINTNQRKLPKALIEATKVHMESGEKTHAQTIRTIAFALAQDGDSVWHGKVNMTGARDPQKPVTYEGLRRATGNMMQERLIGRLLSRDFDLEEVAKKYWELVSRTSAPAWNERPKLITNESGDVEEVDVKYRLKDLAGVASVSRLGADIIGTSLDKSKTEEEFWSSVADLVSKLGQIDWEKREGNPWTSQGAGFAGQTGLYKMLYELVYQDKAPGVAAEAEDAA